MPAKIVRSLSSLVAKTLSKTQEIFKSVTVWIDLWSNFANKKKGALKMTYVITEPCIDVKDTACVDVCPVDCFYPLPDSDEFEGEAQLYIDPAECID